MEGVVGEDGVRRYFGKYPGRVLDNRARSGGEHRGELTVEVPGFLEDLPDGSGRRPLQVTARPCFPPGLFWVPAPGQPVWVEFAAGHLDQAIWSGVWYPSDKAPRTADDKAPGVEQKVLRTAGGHVVEFDDSGTEPRLVVADAAGNQVTLGNGAVKIVANGEGARLTVASGSASIILHSDGIDVDDGKGHKISMSATGVGITGTEPVVLSELISLFEGHMHVTSMGPALLSPADKVKLATAKAIPGKLLSQHVTVG